jgi:TatD DNase family protein
MNRADAIERSALVDFHCHLDLYPDLQVAIDQCEEDAVYTLAVTTTPKAWHRNHELASRTKYVRAALGLHPQLVAERAAELALWNELVPTTRYVGEVGLDSGPSHFRSLALQKQVFEAILTRCAALGDRILTVHSVRSVKPVLDMIHARLPRTRGRVVLHWFTGSASELRRALELGCFFSVNAAMLDGERREACVAAIPSDRILTETDGPFTQTMGRPSRPSDVSATVVKLAGMRGVESAVMARQITANLKHLIAG